MLAHSLSRIMAILPTRLKYLLAQAKPLYTRTIALVNPVATISVDRYTLLWPVDQITSQRHILGTYEPHMQQAFLRWLKPGDVVYDVGAHAGFHMLLAASLVGSAGHVYAFEPHPVNFSSLQRRYAANSSLQGRVTLLQSALGEQSGQATLLVTADLSQGALSSQGDIPVAVRSIDDLIATREILPPQLIKIDVEGHEAAVLQGATGCIRDHRPIILCDYNDAETLPMVRRALDGYGYQVLAGPPVIALPQGDAATPQ